LKKRKTENKNSARARSKIFSLISKEIANKEGSYNKNKKPILWNLACDEM
jgi:hypothetical protein